MKSEDFFLSFFHENDTTEQQRIISYFSSKHPDLLSLETNDPQYLLQKARFFHKNEVWNKTKTILEKYETVFEWKEGDIYPSQIGYLIKIDVLAHTEKSKKDVVDFIESHKHVYHTPNIWQRYAITPPMSRKNWFNCHLLKTSMKLSNDDNWKLSEQRGKTTVLLFGQPGGPCRAELREVQTSQA